MTPTTQDPYCYPGTTVLKNVPAIKNQEELDRFEAGKVTINIEKLSETPIKNTNAYDRLRETHRRIFEGVYEWAGEFRVGTGRVSKARDGHIVTYSDSAYIKSELKKVFANLGEEDFLHNLTREKFAKRCAHYYGEIDAIHPFREGNSRTLRQFTSDLAKQAGHRLEWARLTGDKITRENLHLARDLAVMNADSKQLAEIMERALSPMVELTASKNVHRNQSVDQGMGL